MGGYVRRGLRGRQRALRATLTRVFRSPVLSMSALEAGECNLLRAPFSLREMVDSVLCAMRMAQCDVRLTWTDEAAPLPRSVCGDGGRLSQILLNLLVRAAAGAVLRCCA